MKGRVWETKSHWAQILIEDLEDTLLAKKSFEQTCHDHPHNLPLIRLAHEQQMRLDLYNEFCSMGADQIKISQGILPASFFLQLCIRQNWANYKLLAAFIIQAELNLYTCERPSKGRDQGAIPGTSWRARHESEILNGAMTLKVLRMEGFYGPLLNPNREDFTKHKTILGRCYQLLEDSKFFNHSWHFDDFDFESAFSVKTFRGLSVAPLHLRELARIRADIVRTLSDTGVTHFEVNLVVLFIFCKYLPINTRNKQLKKYSAFLDRQADAGNEAFNAFHIRDARDPFIVLARFLNKKIPCMPQFLIQFQPNFKEPCVKNIF